MLMLSAEEFQKFIKVFTNLSIDLSIDTYFKKRLK
jgi:hypothetical protein